MLFWPLLFVEVLVASANICITPLPCSCTHSDDGQHTDVYFVLCQEKRFSVLPPFNKTIVNERYVYFDFSNNTLTGVYNFAFSNLTLLSSCEVTMRLSGNKLQNITELAFAGIKNNIVNLDISNNLFSFITKGIYHLKNLEYLQMDNNPIRNLDGSFFSQASNSLRTLFIDFKYFNHWPKAMEDLHGLSVLVLSGVNVFDIPDDGFKAFADSLEWLTILHCSRPKIPKAICGLRNVTGLDLQYNNFGNWSLQCAKKVESVNHVMILNCGLTQLPDILFSLPNVSILTLFSNNISSMDETIVPNNTNITMLDLSFNRFSKIPSAINKMTALKRLDFSNNELTIIENSNLNNLKQLLTVDFSMNNIDTVEDYAFIGNSIVSEIDINYNRLEKFPTSFRWLENIEEVDILGNEIDCSCSEMHGLKGWKVYDNQIIFGECKNLKSIGLVYFINDILPWCL